MSYLGLKYGITLDTTDNEAAITEGNYVSSDGMVIWDYSNNAAYHHNVAGIGRDDASALNQKQARSMTVDTPLTVGLGGIYTTNAANPNSFATNLSFLMWGDNGQSMDTLVDLNTGQCVPPGVTDKRIQRIWKMQATADVGEVVLQLNSLPFNSVYPVYMLVADDPDFGTYDAIPVTVNNEGKFVTRYDFPANAVKYISFAGNTSLPTNICTGGRKSIDWFVEGWDWGQNSKTITKGDQTFTFTIDAAGDDIWYGKAGNLGWQQGDWYPARHGHSIWIPRWSTAAQAAQPITFKMHMDKPAMSVSMEVCDVDDYANQDHLKITGKLGNINVDPKLSLVKTPYSSPWIATLLAVDEAKGGKLPWNCLNPGRVLINFERPVDTVEIRYTLDNPYNLSKLFNGIQIKGIDVQC
ncbi:MAG: hypothetical protein ACK4RS_06765, partial [Thiothrix sp.]